ncbi:MAG: sulfotransferase [Desulfobacterales bacterium]|nr:sulfotransferase [Desulfobacterales bacterium]
MIPFDHEMQFRILKLHLKQKGLSSTTLRYLLAMLPIISLNHIVHQFFFILDDILFPSYRDISTYGSIFMVGPPRCGTSLFQFAPSICEKLLYLQIGKMDRFLGSPLFKSYLKLNEKLFGEFKKIHETSLFHYEEDAMLFYHSGNSPFFLFFFPFYELKTPFMNFDRDTSAEYKTKFMDYYKKCIQKHLFVFGKEKTFLSKNPFFSSYVLTLKEHFKDARFIFMTRTPYKVAPSAISLSTFFKDYLRYVDDDFMKNALFEMLKMQYTYPPEALDFGDKAHNAMIRFEELVADTKATVEKVLQQFHLKCPDALKQALAERSKKEKSYVSKNRYSLEKYHIGEKEFETHFKEIMLRFGYGEESAGN